MSRISTRAPERRRESGTGFSMTAARYASHAAPARSSTDEANCMTTRLQERYQSTVKPALMQEFGYKNPLQVPKLDKIVVNMGVGEAVQDAKKIDAAVGDLTAITGQHPVVIRARRSIATFKLRQNMQIGR